MLRFRDIAITVGLLMAVLTASEAVAQETFYRGLLNGLARLSQPSDPSAQRFGQFRVSPDFFSDGWRFDFNRSFGPDALGAPNRIDLGVVDLTLNSGQIRWSGQYSRRGLDQIEFNAATAQPINYTFAVNTGIQDFSIQNAQLAYTTSWNINQLGFYDYILEVSHRGEFDIDGMAIVDSGTLDFDIGPINMSGNLLGDALAAVTAPLFAGGNQENPFTQFSGRATKQMQVESSRESLIAKARSGEILSEEELGELVEASVVAAAMAGTIPDFTFMAEEAFASTLEENDVLLGDGDGAGAVFDDNNLLVPEPTTAALLIMASAALLAIRRQR